MVSDKTALVRNGGESRKGEKRKNPRTKESRNRYAGPRKLEWTKQKEKIVDDNAKLVSEGLCVFK